MINPSIVVNNCTFHEIALVSQTAGNYLVLVPDLFFARKSAEGSKIIATLLLRQMVLKIQTPVFLDENEWQQLSNKWRNKNTTYSTKLVIILIKLCWSICHLNLIKRCVNFMENFKELIGEVPALLELFISFLSEMC